MPLLRQFNKTVLTLHMLAEATDDKHEHQAHIWLYVVSTAVAESECV